MSRSFDPASFLPAMMLVAAAIGMPSAATGRHLPADQVAAHLVAVADREWRDWGQTEIDASDGHSRLIRRGATETDRGWLPAKSSCNAALRRTRGRGCHHQTAFDAHERLRRYWLEGLGPDSRPARDPAVLARYARHSAWSAVFVSYLMREVGLADEAFPFDAAHSNYLRGLAERADGFDEQAAPDAADAAEAPAGTAAAPAAPQPVAARTTAEEDIDDDLHDARSDSDAPGGRLPRSAPERRAQFAVLLARDTPLAAGDLVCGPRNFSNDRGVLSLQTMRSLADLERLRGSHCDLVVVVDRRARQARVIGGNVADSVAMTRIPLTADGRAIRILSRPWFVVVRPQ